MAGGRPAIYDTPEQLKTAIDAYFASLEEDKPFPNLPELCANLGFASRQSFLDYEKRSDEFSCVIKNTRERMFGTKLRLAAQGKLNPTMVIFDAVNHHGCVNTKTENKQNHGGEIVHTHELSTTTQELLQNIQYAPQLTD